MVDTNVGTSVWPAEYSAASPYAASATVTARSGLSISRSGGRIAGIGGCDACVGGRDRHDRGILDRRRAREEAPRLGGRGGGLVGQEPEARVRAGGWVNEIRRSGAPVAREHLVESHHVHERLRVLPLPDGEVERHGRRPAARAVHAVIIIRPAGEHGGDLAGEV